MPVEEIMIVLLVGHAFRERYLNWLQSKEEKM
jgi:hypothetical protein